MTENGKMSISELKKKKQLGGWVVTVEKKGKSKKDTMQDLLSSGGDDK